MITKEQAQNVLESFTGTVVSDLHTWIDHEIDELRQKFDHAKDYYEVRTLQGAIAALQKLKLIRESAEDKIKRIR